MKASFYRTVWVSAVLACALAILGRQAISNPAGAKGAQAKVAEAKITALLTERRDLLRQMEMSYLARYKQGQGSLEEVNRASKAAMRADLELPHSRAERLALRQQWADKTQQFEKVAEQRNKMGTALQTELDEARVAHLEAEIDLEREKSSRVTP